MTPFVALLLRLLDRWEDAGAYVPGLVVYTAMTLPIRIGMFYRFGLYRRYWRYATVEDLAHTVRAVVTAAVVTAALFYAVGWVTPEALHLPRSLPWIDGLLALNAVAGLRSFLRWVDQVSRPRPGGDARPVLIYGAAGCGQMIARELLSNPQLGLDPIGFIDDDPHKQGVNILNLPVLGTRERLSAAVHSYGISEVIIAMPTVSGGALLELLQFCRDAGVPARTVPAMYDILGGRVSVSSLRRVEIEDLLRRDPIKTDIAAVRELIRDKRVLITGAGGSIGRELCRQVLRCNPTTLALVGHGENSIFETHAELLQYQQTHAAALNGSEGAAHPRTELTAFIADIRFPGRIQRVVKEFAPDIIFHAAAHKHVPLMELNPVEAIANNVLGTRNLLRAALHSNVEHFVMISTDKAVNPTSVMGASKRAAELLVLRAARESGRRYVAVRFGNVLGSRGSVVLTFRRQISQGGPVTVSHPDIERFFMTIPEAVQLVLQASVIGKGGEIFVLDMGDPIKIVDLAKDLIRLSGLEVGRDIEIRFTGVRPGEKLYEELFVHGEKYASTHHEKILIAQNASAFVPVEMDTVLTRLEAAVREDDDAAVYALLRELIPEYSPGADTRSLPPPGAYRPAPGLFSPPREARSDSGPGPRTGSPPDRRPAVPAGRK
jgi:FlaA1/EpsC-like NDP-sugar epimerase